MTSCVGGLVRMLCSTLSIRFKIFGERRFVHRCSQVSFLRYRDLEVWKSVLRGTGVSRPGAFKRIGEHSPPADGG